MSDKMNEEERGYYDREEAEQRLAESEEFERDNEENQANDQYEKASCGLTTVRSSKTSRSLNNKSNRIVKETARARSKPRPQTSNRLIATMRPGLASSNSKKSHIKMRSTLTRPASRTNNSMSHTNFRVLKDYIKKGLVDILDREYDYHRAD